VLSSSASLMSASRPVGSGAAGRTATSTSDARWDVPRAREPNRKTFAWVSRRRSRMIRRISTIRSEGSSATENSIASPHARARNSVGAGRFLHCRTRVHVQAQKEPPGCFRWPRWAGPFLPREKPV
jgi:hypothetical protein